MFRRMLVEIAFRLRRHCRKSCREFNRSYKSYKSYKSYRTYNESRELMSSPIPQPDLLGHWGRYGGRFVPETLMAPLEELTDAYSSSRDDESFQSELQDRKSTRLNSSHSQISYAVFCF